MATKEQVDTLKADIVDLIDAATTEINEAIESVAEAVAAGSTPDAALDAMSTDVRAVTQRLKDAAAALEGDSEEVPVPQA